VSLTSSLPGIDVVTDTGIGDAGDLDLGDLTRFAPFLPVSTFSLFVPRTLVLREDTDIHGLSKEDT
jgi:hypothetical protein